MLNHTTKLLDSTPLIYKQRKDEVRARAKECHNQIEKIVEKLHQELNGMQKEHKDVLQKQKKEFEEMIWKVNELNEKTILLQKSKNVKEMQAFVPVIQKHMKIGNVHTYPCTYSFPKFLDSKIDEYLEKEMKEKGLPSRRILKVPTVTSSIDTGFPACRMYKSCLYDKAVTDDYKVWMGGEGRLKLFDL